jgi:CelD/BcsL family acetyltransferase involved in cellulose biosynthesis
VLLRSLNGTRVELVERLEAPVLDLGPGWESVYRAKTDAKKRNLHSRRRRQLAALGSLEVRVARTGDELEAALGEAFRLHDLRWQGRPDHSSFGTEAGRRFVAAAFRALGGQDVPRVVTLSLDGRAIAFQSYLGFRGTMYLHRLAFDPAFARYSPGLVNTLDTLAVAASEGIERVEFLGGGERYKLELADRFEPLYEAVGLARGPAGRAAAAARLVRIRLRLRLKRSRLANRVYYRR